MIWTLRSAFQSPATFLEGKMSHNSTRSHQKSRQTKCFKKLSIFLITPLWHPNIMGQIEISSHFFFPTYEFLTNGRPWASLLIFWCLRIIINLFFQDCGGVQSSYFAELKSSGT